MKSNKRGLNLLTIIGLTLIPLKLFGIINWSWIWVLFPLWIDLALALAILILFTIIQVILILLEKPKK